MTQLALHAQVAAAAERRGWDAHSAACFVVAYLRQHGRSFGPTIVEAAAADPMLRPHDGRAWGSVFTRLAREGAIVHAGYQTRANGSPGIVWELAAEQTT